MKGSLKVVGKNKGKHDTSGSTVNENVRRKALADVSNVQSSFARNAAYDGSKPRISVGPGYRTMNLPSRKSAKLDNKGSTLLSACLLAERGGREDGGRGVDG
ncbi:unnamed protein product [Dovyalis caffra]|uniref:Uncharacterized protein n=1 Tax=Dovyalis caffra TaxID=77055 RepID=A0AAV1QZL6_9ROSI|nr:unnamed protein product [Dovyalis caffra]